MDHEKVWRETLEALKLQMTRGTFELYLSWTRAVSLAGDVLTVAVPRREVQEWLEVRLSAVVGRTLREVSGRPLEVRYEVRPPAGAAAPAAEPAAGAAVEAENRRRDFYLVQNAVLDDYMPLMGATGYAVYSLYVRLANNRQGRAWPSYRTICGHLRIGMGTLAETNRLLEVLGLIEVERGDRVMSNRYYIRDVAALDGKAAARIAARAEAEWPEQDTAARRRLLAALSEWRSLQVLWEGRREEDRSREVNGAVAGASAGERGAAGRKQAASGGEAEQDRQTRPNNMLVDSDVDVVDVLLSLGVERRVAARLAAEHGAERVRGWVAYTRGQRNIRTPAGFVVAKLESGEAVPDGW